MSPLQGFEVIDLGVPNPRTTSKVNIFRSFGAVLEISITQQFYTIRHQSNFNENIQNE